jgi:hypothetical protein
VLNDVPTLTFCNGGIQLPDNPLSDLPDADEEYWLLCLNHNDGYYFASWWMMNNLNSGKNNDL